MYIENSEEERWLSNVRDGRSMVFVGERGSGLSTLVDYLLDAELTEEKRRSAALRINARQTHGGVEFLYSIAAKCVRQYYGSPPDVVRGLLIGLRNRFMADDLEDIMLRLCAEFERPRIVIDHLESLADQLDAGQWATLRILVERRQVQLICLSRLSIPEIEKLADSKMAQTISEEPFRPMLNAQQQARFISARILGESLAGGTLISYIARLTGGHRGLTHLICCLIAGHVGEQLVFNETFVDRVVGIHRAQIGTFLDGLIRESEAVDEELGCGRDAELRCAFDCDVAPASLVETSSWQFERLKRLGHIRHSGRDRVEFASELLRSRLRQRWLYLRGDRSTVAPRYAEWLDYDALVRELVRRIAGDGLLALLQRAGPLLEEVVRFWERDGIWWGYESDLLEYLQADGLHTLLMKAELVDSSWLLEQQRAIALVTSARPPITVQPRNLWSRREENEVMEALRLLHVRVGDLLSAMEERLVASGRVKERPRQRVVRLLHISDIHLGRHDAHAPGKVWRAFINTLERPGMFSGDPALAPRPDIVLFTGDLAFSGEVGQYQEATRHLDDLLRVLDLERKDLFMVPGNHDVDRKLTTYLQRAPTTSRETYQLFGDQRWRHLFGARLSAYWEFYNEFYQEVPGRGHDPSDAFVAPQLIDIDDISIAVYLLNAQWCSAGADDQGHLVLGLERLHEELDRMHNRAVRADIRLGLMHQPIDYLADFERDQFFSLLGAKLDLLLRGHLHRNESQKTITPHGELVELAAGGLFVDDQDRNSCQFVEINADSRRYWIRGFRYESSKDLWYPDPRVARPEDNFCYEGDLPAPPVNIRH